jgi:hypothetical protein
MGSIIGLLVGKSIFGHVIGEKLARVLAIGGLFIAVLSVLGTVKCAYDRSIIRQHEEGAELKQAKRERKADANLEKQKDTDAAAKEQRVQEMDNATKGIPDRRPSDRQRAIACRELQREAAERRTAQPTC